MIGGSGGNRMKGVQFVVAESGEKQAVLLDLREWGELWEDMYDSMLARERADDPSVPWETLRAALRLESSGGA